MGHEVNPEVISSLWLVFIGGLAGSIHCLGMCGPLLAMAEGIRAGRWKAWSQLPLHAGRLITYSILGLLAGIAGSALKTSGLALGIQGVASLVGGLLMTLFAFVLFGIIPIKSLTNSGGFSSTKIANLLVSRHPLSGLLLGLYWGLLPCGLVWAWIMGAAGTGSPLSGILVMLVFGAGTVPALLVVGGLGGILSARSRTWFNRIGATTVLIMGVILMLRAAKSAGLLPPLKIAPNVPLY